MICAGGKQRTVAFIGDSLVAWPDGFAEDLKTTFEPKDRFDIFAAGGATVAAILAQFRDRVQGRGYRVLVLNGGINDLTTVGVGGAAAIAATMSTLLSEASADSYIKKILCLCATPWGDHTNWTPARQIETDDYNQLVLEECENHPGLVEHFDLYSLLLDPTATSSDLSFTRLLTTADNGDKLHWNTSVGHPLVYDTLMGSF